MIETRGLLGNDHKKKCTKQSNLISVEKVTARNGGS